MKKRDIFLGLGVMVVTLVFADQLRDLPVINQLPKA